MLKNTKQALLAIKDLKLAIVNFSKCLRSTTIKFSDYFLPSQSQFQPSQAFLLSSMNFHKFSIELSDVIIPTQIEANYREILEVLTSIKRTKRQITRLCFQKEKLTNELNDLVAMGSNTQLTKLNEKIDGLLPIYVQKVDNATELYEKNKRKSLDALIFYQKQYITALRKAFPQREQIPFENIAIDFTELDEIISHCSPSHQ
ncbi:hypothetical protein GPJ56_004933 [Histomonas meleagridis]|uniref:uncharacterized protein n=1 Tax=Histomonas meleagridis TaxID=135588 RepID=UPI0035598114|nr:hypothetical protein GPJ56_004933 [Histomonas meleagridis]KAH0798541.1 hypothetical protein GO595_008406 [Histomonas meleagridis]